MLLTTAVRCVHCIVIPPPPFSPVSGTRAFSAPLRSHVPGARVVPCPGAVNPCQAYFLVGACAGLRRMMGRAHDGPGKGRVLKVEGHVSELSFAYSAALSTLCGVCH